jgi:hypothetical protein
MNQPGENGGIRILSRPWVWGGLALFLLAWNGVAAFYANPFTMTQRYDGVQYQLLARNRLHGHYELGDSAHTVRDEGSHPMWRPGVVWLEQGLAYLFGSVAVASGVASALGTTLLELVMLWLAWRCFGLAAFLVVLSCVVLPLAIGIHLIRLAVGEGPEPWAAAAVLGGLAALVEALRKGSWRWAVAAGVCAGLSEWFRTGNLILFAGPCGVYALAALCRRDRLGWVLPGVALAFFVALGGLGNLFLPSPVDKTAANLWSNLVETRGPKIIETRSEIGDITHCFGGLELAPGTNETYYDYLVRRCRDVRSTDLVRERAAEILAIYGDRLGEVVGRGFWGLRIYTGEFLLGCFLLQVVLSVVRRGRPEIDSLAIAAGAVAFYLGPCVLLKGDEPTHYVVVLLPFFLLVAAQGVVELGRIAWATLQHFRPELAQRFHKDRKLLAGAAAAVFLCFSAGSYRGLLRTIGEYHADAAQEMAYVDALNLEGKRVACRNMGWFVDRDVQTVLLPYARLPELERYVRAHRIDGILLWGDETSLFFTATPYGLKVEDLEKVLRKSKVFGPPRFAGTWKWYPVRDRLYAGGQP